MWPIFTRMTLASTLLLHIDLIPSRKTRLKIYNISRYDNFNLETEAVNGTELLIHDEIMPAYSGFTGLLRIDMVRKIAVAVQSDVVMLYNLSNMYNVSLVHQYTMSGDSISVRPPYWGTTYKPGFIYDSNSTHVNRYVVIKSSVSYDASAFSNTTTFYKGIYPAGNDTVIDIDGSCVSFSFNIA